MNGDDNCHPANVQRAGWAENALALFTKETCGGDRPDDMHHGVPETAVQDLITDLMHLWHQTQQPDHPSPHDVASRAARILADELDQPDEE
jgi:hypothetical protein